MKLCIPTDNDGREKSVLHDHFGRASRRRHPGPLDAGRHR